MSLLCHGLVVGCAIALMARVEKPVLPTTFQWEVSMIENPETVEPAPPEKPPAQPVVQPSRPHVKPITPIQQAAQSTVHDVAVPVETVQAVRQIIRDAAAQVVPSRQEPMMEEAPS